MLGTVVTFSVTGLGDLLEFGVVIISLFPSNLDVDNILFVDVGGATVGVSTSMSPIPAMSISFSFEKMSFLDGILEDFVVLIDGAVVLTIMSVLKAVL